jgi:hypothetical protein
MCFPMLSFWEAEKRKKSHKCLKRLGDPGWIRTSDLQLRRLLLYPLSYGAVGEEAFIERISEKPR